ncbi:MAG: beta-ketoacyl-[acyl-carrier-protein] synthase II, partial [FCB group bacterium]|nr:beta-ketoacyl-[acyl-carrier-protein] synthase II [FCB group bacterium]
MNGPLKKVVVTGMGVVSPIGSTLADFWNSLLAGKSGMGLITRFDTSDFTTKIAAEIKGFDPQNYMDRKESRRMDLFCQYAMASAQMAVENANLDPEKVDGNRVAVIVGSGIGGLAVYANQGVGAPEKGPPPTRPLFSPVTNVEYS